MLIYDVPPDITDTHNYEEAIALGGLFGSGSSQPAMLVIPDRTPGESPDVYRIEATGVPREFNDTDVTDAPGDLTTQRFRPLVGGYRHVRDF